MPVSVQSTEDGKFRCPYCPSKHEKAWGVLVHCQHAHKDKEKPNVSRPFAAGKPKKAESKKTTPETTKVEKISKVEQEPKVEKKPKPVAKPKIEVAAAPTLNFCPCCGTNLVLISTAMEIAAKVSESNNG